MTKKEQKQYCEEERKDSAWYLEEMEYYGYSDEEIQELWDKD